MPGTVYSGFTLYGSPTALYGRASAQLLNAQARKVRETGLYAQVIDEGLNAWEYVTGVHSQPAAGLGRGFYKPANGTYHQWEPDFWSYRGAGWFCALTNGTIIRLRQGDPSNISDRQLWIQTITDPTNLSQWTSWSVLYSGTHYGTPVVQESLTPNVYNVYHCKIDGLYRNNVKMIDNDELNWYGDTPPHAMYWRPVVNAANMGWVQTIRRDEYDHHRVIDSFFIEDLQSYSSYDAEPDNGLNYAWHRQTLTAYLSGSTVHGIFAAPLYTDPRDSNGGTVLASFTKDLLLPDHSSTSTLRSFRGIGGGAGNNYLSGVKLTLGGDGYYYLFAYENHGPYKKADEPDTSLGYGFPVWQRSKDFVNWTEPVIGPPIHSAWGGTGMIEVDDYAYFADGEVVYRRPLEIQYYDISNYIPSLNFELPRDNQPASGVIQVANPAGVNDFLQDLSDREIEIYPAIRLETGAWEYTQFDRFFITQCNRSINGNSNRLEMAISNIWGRLDNTMRDVINFVGRTTWDDWSTGKRNEPFNYFFATDTHPTVDDENRLYTRGIVLYTGWKGHNPDITVTFQADTGYGRVITRYQDKDNYFYVEVNAGTLNVYERKAAVNTLMISTGIGTPSVYKIRVRWRWTYLQIWVNDSLVINNFTVDSKVRKQGYAGFAATRGKYKILNFHLEDWETDLNMEDLIRQALAMGDFHDVTVGGGDAKAYALSWGPQTDNDTPAKALQTILETQKLQLAWINNRVQVGRFNDVDPVRTIVDTIIESEEVDEAKRRINLVAIDGNDKFWLEVDTTDAGRRGRMINAYFDLPELLYQDDVTQRAREELKRAAQGSSPGGTTPLYFDLWRMDAVTWIDNAGNEQVVRIEGFSVDIDQSVKPHQRMTFDTSEYSQSSDDGLMEPDE